MKKYFLIVLTFFMTILFSTCSNPTPSLSSITPIWKVTHMPAFTLTATGSGFFEESVIVFNGQEKETTFVSETELTCEISPEDTIVTAPVKNSLEGSTLSETAVPVLVRNPSPGGGDSETINFTIKDNHTFSTPIRLTESFSNAMSLHSTIDSDGKLYMLVRNRDPNSIYYLITSTDNGSTWSDPERITDSDCSAISGCILVDSDKNLHFFCHICTGGRPEIYYHRKLASENHWENKKMLSVPDPQDLGNSSPCVVLNNGRIIVFWCKTKLFDQSPIMMSFSNDSGTSWSNPKYLSQLGRGWVRFSPCVSESGVLLLSYEFYTGSGSEIKFSTSSDNGQSWSEPIMLSDRTGQSKMSQVLYSGIGQNITVIWFYTKYDSYHLQMASSQNLGSEWSGISNIYDYSFFKELVITGFTANCDSAGNINLAWPDGPNENNFKVFYMRSIDMGTTWTTHHKIWQSKSAVVSFMKLDYLGNLYLSLNDVFDPYGNLAYFAGSIQ